VFSDLPSIKTEKTVTLNHDVQAWANDEPAELAFVSPEEREEPIRKAFNVFGKSKMGKEKVCGLLPYHNFGRPLRQILDS